MPAVVHEISQARKFIDVQAYLMTARPIIDALQAAHARGVNVRVILDKDNIGGVYSAASSYFRGDSFPVWRDGRHKEAHNKVMLIDGRTIITGSFNFTQQAEDVNAENVLIIRDKPRLFAAYLRNFEDHLQHSERLNAP